MCGPRDLYLLLVVGLCFPLAQLSSDVAHTLIVLSTNNLCVHLTALHLHISDFHARRPSIYGHGLAVSVVKMCPRLVHFLFDCDNIETVLEELLDHLPLTLEDFAFTFPMSRDFLQREAVLAAFIASKRCSDACFGSYLMINMQKSRLPI